MNDPTMPATVICQVERSVLVDLIAIAVAACQEYNDPAVIPMERLLCDVRGERRDTLTAADWREIGGGE